MVHLLGAGSAYPATQISDDFLQGMLPSVAASPDFLHGSEIRGRKSVLSNNFISETRNRDLVESRRRASETPTTLAVQAIDRAIERAGITRSDIGLIVADTATPFQTCPSEAQRIGGALGLKIPAYDVVGGAAAFFTFLDLLNSWHEDRLPQYCALISTNTPTLHVDYGCDPTAARIFGDGAAAVVVSTQVPGKLTIGSTRSFPSRGFAGVFGIDRYLTVDGSRLSAPSEVVGTTLEALSGIERRKERSDSQLFVIGPPLFEQELSRACQMKNLPNTHVVNTVQECGFSLGTTQMAAFAEVWEKFLPGDVCVVVSLADSWTGVCEMVVSR